MVGEISPHDLPSGTSTFYRPSKINGTAITNLEVSLIGQETSTSVRTSSTDVSSDALEQFRCACKIVSNHDLTVKT